MFCCVSNQFFLEMFKKSIELSEEQECHSRCHAVYSDKGYANHLRSTLNILYYKHLQWNELSNCYTKDLLSNQLDIVDI